LLFVGIDGRIILLKADVKETKSKDVDSGYGSVAVLFEHENRSSGSIKCWKFID
jgi:hypothetical protein